MQDVMFDIRLHRMREMNHYLHCAEEERSDLTKSFWFGKFLQSLSADVLLRCRQWAQRAQHGASTRDMSEENGSDVSFAPTGKTEEPLWVHVKRADECLRSCKTSLSPLVHRLIVDSMRHAHMRTIDEPQSLVMASLPLAVLREDHTLEWTAVASYLGSDVVQERWDYSNGAMKCAALAAHVGSAVRSLPLTTLWEHMFTWTRNDRVFTECVELLLPSSTLSPPHVSHHLSLLLCSAALERALGDVYLSISRASQCPSLLRDLLVTQELEDTFGTTAMCCLRCLIGPPSGLNLRNLLWHGFTSPGEICPDYVYLLLAITASLSRAVTSPPVELVHRPPLSLTQQETDITGTFPELSGEDMQCVEQLFSSSFFILPSMLSLWLAGLTAFREGRYHHCLVLLLPGLEHGLRRVFACINHCPHRVLTAESTVLYTTFDEILSPVLPDLSDNGLRNEIGRGKLECLLDMLVHPEGPRLRDRISHGEVDFYELSVCMASHLISVLILFCAQYGLNHALGTESVIVKCLAAEKSYTSLFHPLSLLKRELLQVAEQIDSWSSVPLPPSPHSHQDQPSITPPPQPEKPSLPPCSLANFTTAVGRLVEPLGDTVELHSVLHQVTGLHYCAAMSESGLFSAALSGLVSEVWRVVGVNTLYCSRVQLEMTGIMRHTIRHATTILSQIRDVAVLRYDQQLQRQLRSRQRKNYQYLVTSLPTYRAALCLLVVMTVSTVSRLPPLTRTETTTKKAIKFHKKVLQLSENLSSQTGPSRNRWEEANELAHSLTQLSL